MQDRAPGSEQLREGRRPPRFAIVGAGRMGRWHLAAARAAGARPVVFVDPDRSARERLARGAAGVATAAHLDDWPGTIDVAHVCTPVETHSDIVGELLDRGIHVFVEKPLAQTAAEVRALTQRADRRKVLLCPAHQYAFQAGLRRVVAELPHVGSLRRVDFDICSAGAVGPFAGRPIDVIGEILPHPLSILQAVAPRCDLGKLDWSVRSGEGGRELLASTRVETALVSLFISLAARPTSFRTRLQGERATFEVDGFQGGAIRLPARSTRVAKLLAAYERAGRLAIGASATLAARVVRGETAYPGLRSLVKRFYAAVDGAPAPVTTPHMVEAAAARDNLLRELRGATGASAR